MNIIKKSSSYRAVNTLCVGYKNQSVNVVYESNRCLFWDPYETYKYNVWAERRILSLTGVSYIITGFLGVTTVSNKVGERWGGATQTLWNV